MTVPMPVPVPSSTPMRVSVMPAGRDQPSEVDGESDGADGEELAGVHLGRVDETLNRFKDDENRDEAQEDAVGEAREGLDARVAARMRRGVSGR